MAYFVLSEKRHFRVFGILLGFCFVGCASDHDQDLHQLTRQQSATIESLQSEITRLNQELEDALGSRDILTLLKPELEKAFAKEIATGNALIAFDQQGLKITFFDRILFDPEETRLLPSGEEVLNKLAVFFAKEFFKNRIFIEGHTDNQPVEGSEGITNWEYSVGRATAVLHYFLNSKGLSPERFKVSGYGEYRPLASNETASGRSRNRRVDIIVSFSKTTDAWN